MEPYIQRMPEPRLMARLADQLRGEDRVRAFMAAGDALAVALLGTPEGAELPEWVDGLADRMVGALLLVEDETIDDASPSDRLALATAAIVLSTLRPRASSATDGAVSLWVGWGMGTPRCLPCETGLLQWTLLRLFLDDPEGAAEAVHVLLDRGAFGPGMVLHDWVVSALQRQGPSRQTMCFEHLRTVFTCSQGASHPSLLVVAAVVLNQLGPMRRGEVRAWLQQHAPVKALEAV